MDSAWPSFMAPPLSSPRTRKICSAVRCWISCATISAGRPPIRFPTPMAVRPASPIGSLAIFAARVSGFLGTSFTLVIVPHDRGRPVRPGPAGVRPGRGLAANSGADITAVTATAERGQRLTALGAASVVHDIDASAGPFDLVLESTGGKNLALAVD